MNLHLLFGMSFQAGMLPIVSYQSPGPRTRSCQSDCEPFAPRAKQACSKKNTTGRR